MYDWLKSGREVRLSNGFPVDDGWTIMINSEKVEMYKEKRWEKS